MKYIMFVMAISIFLYACEGSQTSSSNKKESEAVERQNKQYSIGQPIPVFDWSLERHLVTELYRIRNQKAATHSVWRSDRGWIEGDCPSYGYGIPYDTSLTNPLVSQWKFRANGGAAGVSVEQQEPNGVFASKATAATWVMCLGEAGSIEPVYVETKVTVYPGPVKVDYNTNRVVRSGAATILIPKE